MIPSEFPIGVFDSGVGGLTVLHELRQRLPGEDFVYLGDNARLPYGTKSSGVVTRYARHCVEFLLKQPVKAVVIACNTASAMALDTLRTEIDVPLFGVIAPGVKAGLSASSRGRILVLATDSTVRSEAYPKEFLAQGGEAQVEQLACPLLVPLAEEGWFDHPVTADVIGRYLAKTSGDFDTVVLGCTHYPLLAESFRQALGTEIALVHGAATLAKDLSATLDERALRNPRASGGQTRFLSTDRIAANLPMLEKLFAGPVRFETVDL